MPVRTLRSSQKIIPLQKKFARSAAGILDGAALFSGVLIFFLGGLLIGGWKGWVGSFIAGGCLFLAASSIFHAIAAMRN